MARKYGLDAHVPNKTHPGLGFDEGAAGLAFKTWNTARLADSECTDVACTVRAQIRRPEGPSQVPMAKIAAPTTETELWWVDHIHLHIVVNTSSHRHAYACMTTTRVVCISHILSA